MTNELLDMKLFKVCYPKVRNAQIGQISDEIIYGEKGYVESVNRFTQSVEMCFSVLIPEMNRRGFDFEYRKDARHLLCNAKFTDERTFKIFKESDPQPTVAIAKAAEKALEISVK